MEKVTKKILSFVIVALAVLVLSIFIFNGSLTGKAIIDYNQTKYAPPYNVLEGNKSIFNISNDILTANEDDLVRLDTNLSLDSGYIYKKGYIYNHRINDWEVFNFIQTPVENSYWIEDFASADLIVNASSILVNGDNYIVAYACKKYDGKWQCGCQTEDEANGEGCARWMLHKFVVNNITSPANNTVSCTSNADCILGECDNATGVCVIGGVLSESPKVIPPMNDSDGDGYLEILHCEQLQNMSVNLTTSYELMGNINCSETRNWNCDTGGQNCKGFKPISFLGGNLNGSGFSIFNLYINRSDEDEVALFAGTGVGANPRSLPLISNLSLISVEVIGRDYVGGLLGNQNNIDVKDVFVNGSVRGTGTNYVGGLVGANPGFGGSVVSAFTNVNVNGNNNVGGLVGGSLGSSSISNSYSTGSVNGNNYVGGLVGSSFSISNSYSTGSVNGNNHVGGLVGWSTGTTFNSYANNDVYGKNYTGGLVGYTNALINRSYSIGVTSGVNNVGGLVGKSDSNVEQSFSLGNLNGSKIIGGLVGNSTGWIKYSYSHVNVTSSGGEGSSVGGLVGQKSAVNNITQSYSVGKVVCIKDCWGSAGGLVGWNMVGYPWNGNIFKSYWDNQSSGLSVSRGGVGYTTNQMKNIGGWYPEIHRQLEEDIWAIGSGKNNGYPYLRWQNL